MDRHECEGAMNGDVPRFINIDGDGYAVVTVWGHKDSWHFKYCPFCGVEFGKETVADRDRCPGYGKVGSKTGDVMRCTNSTCRVYGYTRYASIPAGDTSADAQGYTDDTAMLEMVAVVRRLNVEVAHQLLEQGKPYRYTYEELFDRLQALDSYYESKQA